MATNPVFNRIDKEAGQYAGFGAQQQGQPQGAPQAGPPQGQPYAQGMPMNHGQGQSMSPEQLEQMYGQPPAGPAQTGRLTLDDVVMKSMMLFAIVAGVALATAWVLRPDDFGNVSPLASPIWLFGMFASLGLGMAIGFKKTVSVPLILVHAVVQGAFLGAISITFASYYDGVVTSAVLATMGTFAGMFLAWKIGFIKVTSKSRRIFGMMAMGYLVFALVNIGSSLLGFGSVYSGPLAIIVSLFGVAMASYSLAVDFDSIDRGIQAGAPERYSWLMGHGLIASLVWLYIEFLRLFAILQGND